eukprot:scaffold39167_cov155-Skeletonema_dohrnii-CCMP3373.AAC.2
MVTLIRTLKRITPALAPLKQTSEAKTAATIAIALGPIPSPPDDLAAHVFHDSLLKGDEAAATATEAVAMNKNSSPASSDDKISPRKASTATADTSIDVSDGTATPMNSGVKKINYCSSEGCPNQVVNGGVCNRHGAKVKLCSKEGCTNKAKKGGVCIKHGAKIIRKRCSREGCTNQVMQGGVCTKHGAKRLCYRHGTKRKERCSGEGCTNQALKGGVCWRHGAKKKLCSTEGCTNVVVGGVCMRHVAKVTRTRKLCSREECTNQAKKGGVCIRHGANVKLCSSEGCTNQVRQGGVCVRHGEGGGVC